MKKTIAMLLAACMTVCLIAAPASAAGIKISWPDWQSIYDWFYHPPAEVEAPAETKDAEEPMESEAQAETEAPEEEIYTIRYSANGGYWWSQYASPAISNSKSYQVKSGETHKILSTAPIRTGYTFSGWRDSDGNEYEAGDVITPTQSMTMNAIWK